MPNPAPARRKLTTLPGRDYSEAEADVAAVLYRTYREECMRHMEKRGVARKAYAADACRLRIGEMRQDHDVSDNIEDVPKRESKRGSNLWLALARFMIEKRLDPERFVRCQFAMLPDIADPPRPEALKAAATMRNYEIGQQRIVREVATAYRLQLQYFQAKALNSRADHPEITDEDGWIRALCDPDTPLSELFRYCVAYDVAGRKTTVKRSNFAGIAESLALPAALRYIYDRAAYREVWKHFIPAHFDEFATDVYRRYHGLSVTEGL